MNRFFTRARLIVKKFASVFIISLLLVLCVSILVLSFRFESFASRVGGSGVEAGQAMENLRQSVVMLSKDAQEMREIMRLPSHDYPFSKIRPNNEPASNSEQVENPNELFFKGLDYLRIIGQKSHTQDFFQKIKTDGQLTGVLNSLGLKLRTKSTNEIEVLKGQNVLYSFEISAKTGAMIISALGVGDIPFIETQDIDSLIKILKDKTPSVIERSLKLGPMIQVVNQIQSVNPVQKLLARRVLNIDEPLILQASISRTLRRSDGSKLIDIGLDYEKQMFFINDVFFATQGDFMAQISKQIDSLDLRTAKDVFVDKNRDLLKNLSKDKGFAAFATEQGLSLSQTERADSDYYYYDVIGRDKIVMGSFAVQKWEGTLWIMDPRDIPISRLDSLDFSKFTEKKN